jgi:hypothetical protein
MPEEPIVLQALYLVSPRSLVVLVVVKSHEEARNEKVRVSRSERFGTFAG